MDMSKAYYDEFNRNKHNELNKILEGLPDFCYEYFMGVEMRTSILTRLNYARDFVIFFDFLVKNKKSLRGFKIIDLTIAHIDSLEPTDLERFLNYLSYYDMNGKDYQNGEKAKARKMSAVRSLFKYFYNKGKLKENITSKVSNPKLHDKAIIRLDNQEVETLLDNVEAPKKFASTRQNKYNLNTRTRDTAIITLLLGTGIRVSECVGLNIEDIDMEKNSFIIVRKGGNSAIMYFSDEVKDALFEYMNDRAKRMKSKNIDSSEKALFLSLQNKRITIRAVENLVKKHAKTATPLKNITPHKLRSTYGTALYRNTKDIYVVAEVLGHKDVNTTKKHYAALDEDIKRDAAGKVILRKESDE